MDPSDPSVVVVVVDGVALWIVPTRAAELCLQLLAFRPGSVPGRSRGSMLLLAVIFCDRTGDDRTSSGRVPQTADQNKPRGLVQTGPPSRTLDTRRLAGSFSSGRDAEQEAAAVFSLETTEIHEA